MKINTTSSWSRIWECYAQPGLDLFCAKYCECAYFIYVYVMPSSPDEICHIVLIFPSRFLRMLTFLYESRTRISAIFV